MIRGLRHVSRVPSTIPSVLAKRWICRGGAVDFSSIRTLDIIAYPNCCWRQRPVFVQRFRARRRTSGVAHAWDDRSDRARRFLICWSTSSRTATRIVSNDDLIASVWGGRIVSRPSSCRAKHRRRLRFFWSEQSKNAPHGNVVNVWLIR